MALAFNPPLSPSHSFYSKNKRNEKKKSVGEDLPIPFRKLYKQKGIRRE